MINSINCCNPKPNFCGTTIIKKEGSNFLTKEIAEAANNSTNGYISTRLDGFSLVVVSNVFKKQEDKFLKHIADQGIDYVNSSKVINYRNFSVQNLKNLLKDLIKTGLI